MGNIDAFPYSDMGGGVKVVASLVALCAVPVIAVALPAQAASSSAATSSALKTWYQHTGHPASERFLGMTDDFNK